MATSCMKSLRKTLQQISIASREELAKLLFIIYYLQKYLNYSKKIT